MCNSYSQEQIDTQSQVIQKNNSYDMNFIAQEDITKSTIKNSIGIQDINTVVQEIKRTQKRNIQKNIDK